jgi:hypothetical protein
MVGMEFAARHDTGLAIIDRVPLRYRAIVFLGIAIFVYRFLLSPEFFIYEDDVHYYGEYLNKCPHIWDQIKWVLANFPQGRPIGYIAQITLTCSVGEHLGLGYFINFLLIWADVALFYLLVERLFGWKTALISSVLAIIQPFDTTAAFYNSVAFPDLSLFFGLIGANFLARKQNALASLALLAALLTYEAGGAVAALPLLAIAANKIRAADRRLLTWAPSAFAAVIAPTVVYVVLRALFPDQRLTASLTPDLLHGMAVRFTLFIESVFKILWFSASEVFRSQYPSALALSAFSMVALAALLALLLPRAATANERAGEVTQGAATAGRAYSSIPLVCAAIGVIVVSYAFFSISYDAYPGVAGRAGRYNQGAALGLSLLLAGAFVVLQRAGGIIRKLSFIALAALVFLWGAYAFVVQRQLVEIGRLELKAYGEILAKLDGLSPGTDVLIINPDHHLRGSGFIAMEIYSWMLGALPRIVFDVPDSNSIAVIEPKLAVDPNGQVDLASGSFRIATPYNPKLRAGHIIAVRWSGLYAERLASLKVDGKELLVQPPSSGGKAFSQLPLTRFGRWLFARYVPLRDSVR